MKRVLIVFLIIMLLLTGCTNVSNEDVSLLKNTIKEQELKIKDLEKELEALGVQGREQAESERMSERDKEENEDSIFIETGQNVVIDDYCEFVITSTTFSKKIMPPRPDSFYSYYEAKEPKTTYLDVVIDIKSLLTTGKIADEFATVKIVYNDKYEYSTFSTIEEDNGSDFTYTNITSIEPLKRGILHFLAEVPEEVESGDESVIAIVTIYNQNYKYTIR